MTSSSIGQNNDVFAYRLEPSFEELFSPTSFSAIMTLFSRRSLMSRRKRQPSTSVATSPTGSLPRLESLSPLEAPKFPKFDELVHPKTFQLGEVASLPTSKPQGLFSGLLGDEAAVLHRDATENPSKYDGQTAGLLEKIIQGEKSVKTLTDEERTLLDRATLSFASYVSPKPPKKESTRRVTQRAVLAQAPSEGPPIPGVDTPEGTPPAFWWL
jgi:hypothetical protein